MSIVARTCMFVVLVMFVFGCSSKSSKSSERSKSSKPPDMSGRWRAVLQSAGGELPFGLVIGKRSYVINGSEQAAISAVTVAERKLTLRFARYDSTIIATLSADGKTLRGEWRKASTKGQSVLPFSATKGDMHRFTRAAESTTASPQIAGSWAIEFVDKGGAYRGVGELSATGHNVTGTILTATGDYRYLHGDYANGRLRLSTFDGAHAFLFHAISQADGTLKGDFWSRDTYHATFTAKRDANAVKNTLPDPYAEVELTNKQGQLRFRFDDTSGKPVSLSDARYRNKVVLVDVFGTWCPNCNDMAPLLRRWHHKYNKRGLEIIGIAFELTGSAKRDREQVQVYKRHHKLDFPLLLAGTSDKKAAAAVLSDLSAIKSYPTTIFVGRDGKVHKIHSGFAGPATGSHHTTMVAEMEKTIEHLLGRQR